MKHTIEEMKHFAKMKGGECLSNEYLNSTSKLLWKCKDNHEWWASSAAVFNRGNWCKICSINRCKLTIELMQDIAKKRGGKCLSKEYINDRTKLRWECKSGHRWYAMPRSIKFSKSWCPICARINYQIFFLRYKKYPL